MDELHNGRGLYRKRRKHVGKDWTPKMANAGGPGIWCPSCRKRHRYSSKMQLGASFDKRQGVFYIQWYCKKTGNILKEQALGG